MRRSLAIAVVLGAAGGACMVMNGLHVPPPDEGPPVPDSAVDTGDPCEHARPPADPPTFVDGDGGGEPFLYALRSVRLTDEEGGAPTGFDIDGVCTCTSGPPSCVSATPYCDGPGGRDNAFAAIVQSLGVLELDLAGTLNARVASGNGGIVVRVDRYDGQADDSDVQVSMYASGGPFAGDGGFDASLDPDGGYARVPPLFDKRDQWTVNKDELVSPTATDSSHQGSGYVRDFVLVATIDAYLEIVPGTRTIWKGARLTGRIAKDADGAWTVTDGIINGRWPTAQIIETFGRFPNGNGPGSNCDVQGWHDLAQSIVCPFADVANNEALDRTGSPCNAVSIALAYVAAPASFGPPVHVDPGPPRCTDAGRVTCDDAGE